MNLTDELRAAADKLRRLAKNAPAGPWTCVHRYRRNSEHIAHSEVHQPSGAQRLYRPGQTAEAEYIAAMNPSVGALLANLLDVEADVVAARTAQDGTEDYAADYGTNYLLDMARLINSTQP